MTSPFFRCFRFQLDSDFVDRLSYFYTSGILTIFALLIFAKQYIGSPIECWIPQSFTSAMEQYVENYCWVQNTYHLPMHEDIPREIYSRRNRELSYYQWIPLLLLVQAICFFFPAILWKILQRWHSVVHVANLVGLAKKAQLMETEERKRAVDTIARQIRDSIQASDLESAHRRGSCCAPSAGCFRHCGCYMTTFYIVIKVLFALNVIVQFFLLHRFFRVQSVVESNWQETGLFPRVTQCDFEVRQVGNVQRFTVQCVLSINMFCEKIVIFCWFWFLLLAVVAVLNCLYWLCILLNPRSSTAHMRKYLHTPTDESVWKKSTAEKRFTRRFLRRDDALALRMIELHGGEAICKEVIMALWEDFTRSINAGGTNPITPLVKEEFT